jgi:CubicO group peptidase (beta-lactamase class C family)
MGAIRQFLSPLSTLVLLASTIQCAQAQNTLAVDPARDAHYLQQLQNALPVAPKVAQVVRFRNWSSLYPARQIRRGESVRELPYNLTDFSSLRYEVEDRRYSLADYLRLNPTAGLLVIKDGIIRYEEYGLGNDETSLWVSFSMSKSVTSMLLGAAIQDGHIQSLDDSVTDYLPLLKNSAYETASIRDVLQMASGVAWNEDYVDPQSDVLSYPAMDVVEMLQFLGNKPRVAEPGSEFNYNTGETDLVGALVRAAIGNNLSDYLEYKIWQPFGMEADAFWATHGPAGERGGCCLNVTLRDYGRIGLFALNGGYLPDGAAVLPEQWLADSTTPSPAYDGYGYLWWLSDNGSYDARGIYGQGIHINPAEQLVIAVLSAWDQAGASGNPAQAHRVALYRAFTEALRD